MPQAHLNVWDGEACRRVHQATQKVLETAGVEFKHERARELLQGAGARVDGTRVRIPAALVDRALSSVTTGVPGQAARRRDRADGPARRARRYFGTGPDCLYVRDVETRRASPRAPRRRARAAALAERLRNVDFVMSMGLPEDAGNDVVDLAQFAAMVKGTRKPIVVSSPFGGDVAARHARDGGALR